MQCLKSLNVYPNIISGLSENYLLIIGIELGSELMIYFLSMISSSSALIFLGAAEVDPSSMKLSPSLSRCGFY